VNAAFESGSSSWSVGSAFSIGQFAEPPLTDGTYALAPATATAMRLEVVGAGTSNGTNVAAWRYDATTAADSGVAQVAFYTAGHWGAPLTISASGFNARMPSVAFDGQRQATVVWEQNTTSSACALKALRGAAGHGFAAAQTISSQRSRHAE
jgi:hypothetical protein